MGGVEIEDKTVYKARKVGFTPIFFNTKIRGESHERRREQCVKGRREGIF